MRLLLFVLVCCLAGCGEKAEREQVALLGGDIGRGRELVEKHECVRCHGQVAARSTSRCLGCHAAIASAARGGDIDLVAVDYPDRERIEGWNARITHFRELPSFVGVTRLLRAEWLRDFLLSPHDLRPQLDETMPALTLSQQDAADVVAYLGTLDDVASTRETIVSNEVADYGRPDGLLEAGHVGRGAALFESSGCRSCHALGGVVAGPATRNGPGVSRALLLAPDLRFTRDRFEPLRLVPWLIKPGHYKPDSAMPETALTHQEARDLAAFIMTAPLADAAPTTSTLRLPPLSRPVRWDEVNEQVFGKVCVHCHADADAEQGDGGPGFAGGFGFRARKLDLSDYESAFAGYLDDNGQRRSAAASASDGNPVLLAALLARLDEQGGKKGAVRGMPLGLPPLSAEQIQLVETWLLQGRPR